MYNTAIYFVSSDVCRAAVRIWLFIFKSPGATGALWLDSKIGCMINMSILNKLNTNLDINGGDNVITIEPDDEISTTEDSHFCHCDLCCRNYATISDLTAHIKHHVDKSFLTEVKEYATNTNNVHAPNNDSLNSSDKGGIKSNGIDLRYNQCHICFGNFSTSAELQLHSIKHPPGKTLKCRFCDLPQPKQMFVTQHEKTCRKNKFKYKIAHVRCVMNRSHRRNFWMNTFA